MRWWDEGEVLRIYYTKSFDSKTWTLVGAMDHGR